MPKIGAHMSIAKGLESAVKSSLKIQADTMQIFSRNPRGSTYKNYSEKEIEDFLHCCEVNEFGLILAHAPYTMNLAASKPEVYEFGCQVIREELKRMEALKIPNLVFHPGSHTGGGKKAGIKRIAVSYTHLVIIGALLAILFGGANAYLGLRVGTVSYTHLSLTSIWHVTCKLTIYYIRCNCKDRCCWLRISVSMSLLNLVKE